MKYRKQLVVALFLGVLILLARFLLQDDLLTISYLQEHKQALLGYIGQHYAYAAAGFMLLYLATAFFLPGALVLTVAGGMAFGTLPAMIFINIAATSGATLAFIATRFVIGDWLQVRFSRHLERFNREIARHGPRYLLILRILPVIPFFAVNYCAAITRIRLSTFIWTTSVGVLPGSFVYAFAGAQMRMAEELQEIASWKVVSALLLVCLFILFPVILRHLSSRE
ncbi:TVP38/TMEM64 family protein [Geobacter sp. SVR]|uniref:TVP38/TMEM64 family protein n=1 Tax=Geobacter sp. SVR TaxID=2495594 RepID=UPI00143EF76D|nr:TVP38/TMEM64 family protein [Geobacter sp. SVR]BCS54459.1 TVP38/TMEM64 family protein [Geobacter sp. SVR]GCF87058.1 TVP38/TMEM64 family protein [Geobacter sp. SVR]